MAAPTTYTESSLATYLVGEVLVNVGTKLGWTDASIEVLNAVNETMLSLDVSDLTTFSTPLLVRKLRAFGRREIWRQAMQVTASKFNLGADGASVDLATIHTQCREQYKLASKEVLDEYSGNETGEETPSVVVSKRACPCDPYVPQAKREEDCET